MSSLFGKISFDKLKMFCDNPIPRSLEILGVVCLLQIAWDLPDLLNLLRPNEEETQMERNYEFIKGTVKKLHQEIRGVAAGINLLVETRSNLDQRTAVHGFDIPVTTIQLQELITKHSFKIEEEVQVLCDSHVEELNALYNAVLQKKREQNGDQEIKELIDDEMRHINEVRRRREESIQRLRVDHAQIVQDEFSSIQLSLCEKFNRLVDETIAKSDKAKSVLKLESKQRRLLAQFEIDLVSSSGDEQSEMLKYQPEDVLDDVHPVIFLWTISSFRQKWLDLMNENKDIQSMAVFAIAPGLNVKPTITRGSEVNRINFQFEFCDDERAGDAAAPSHFLYYRKYVLIDQSPSSDKNDLEAFDRPGFGMNRVDDVMLPFFRETQLCSVEDLKGKGTYVRHDQVLIKIVMEPIALVSKRIVFSDGILEWKIENYLKNKQDAMAGRKCWLISEPFRTSENGYYVQAEIALNGLKNGRLVYISTRIKFLLGENDGKLEGPVRGQCTFYLMDQLESGQKDNISVVREFGLDFIESNGTSIAQTNEVKDWLFPKFVLQTQVEKTPYLVNNSIFLKAKVDIQV